MGSNDKDGSLLGGRAILSMSSRAKSAVFLRQIVDADADASGSGPSSSGPSSSGASGSGASGFLISGSDVFS